MISIEFVRGIILTLLGLLITITIIDSSVNQISDTVDYIMGVAFKVLILTYLVLLMF